MKFDRKHYSDQQLLDLYSALVRPRLIEEKMLILLRQNKISKWFSGIGQEAIAVGITAALESDEYIFSITILYKIKFSIRIRSIPNW